MDWLDDHIQRRRTAEEQAAAALREQERASAREAARIQGEAARRRALIDEGVRDNFDLLQQLGARELLETVQSRYWHDGEIVTVQKKPEEPAGSRSIRTFYGLRYLYNSVSAQQPEQPTLAFDGVFVGIRSEVDEAFFVAAPKRKLLVRAYLGAEQPDAYKHFGRTAIEQARDLLVVQLDPLGPGEIDSLKDRVADALAFDTMARETANRFPTTVAQTDLRVKRGY